MAISWLTGWTNGSTGMEIFASRRGTEEVLSHFEVELGLKPEVGPEVEEEGVPGPSSAQSQDVGV